MKMIHPGLLLYFETAGKYPTLFSIATASTARRKNERLMASQPMLPYSLQSLQPSPNCFNSASRSVCFCNNKAAPKFISSIKSFLSVLKLFDCIFQFGKVVHMPRFFFIPVNIKPHLRLVFFQHIVNTDKKITRKSIHHKYPFFQF